MRITMGLSEPSGHNALSFHAEREVQVAQKYRRWVIGESGTEMPDMRKKQTKIGVYRKHFIVKSFPAFYNKGRWGSCR